MGEGGLPGPVYRPVGFIGDYHIVVATRHFVIAFNQCLKQRNRYLLLLACQSGLEPVAAVSTEYIPDRSNSLVCKLLTVHQEQYPFSKARFEQPFDIKTYQIGLACAGGEF